MSNKKLDITSEQFRAAKAMLGWSNADIAALTGLHRNTINKIDKGGARRTTLALIRAVFEEGNDTHQIEFIAENGGGPGVRLNRKP